MVQKIKNKSDQIQAEASGQKIGATGQSSLNQSNYIQLNDGFDRSSFYRNKPEDKPVRVEEEEKQPASSLLDSSLVESQANFA